VAEKAISEGKTASEVAVLTKAATEGAGLDAESAKEKAADIAAAKITEKALADGESVEAAAGKARAAAEGAGLDAEAAKDRAADVAAEKVAEKAIADGKTAAEAGAEALAAAKAAGVSDEEAKEKAGSRAADLAAKEALEKGFSEEEATKRAKEAAEAAGFSATDADDIARSAASDAVGNRTPDVSNVIAAQLVGTKLLRINYDLSVSDGRPCTVTIRWSTDNGDNFDLTATAVTGDVGPGVAPGKKLEATWDMGVDWDNKYTEDGRIEVIASRISDEGAPDDLVVIPAEGASWDLAKEKKELVVTLPAEVLSPQEVDWIKEARDHERLAWVDVRFPVGDNGEKGFFWGSEDVFIGPAGKVILRFPHTTALDAPGVNLLDIETFAYNGDTLRLSDLPPMGTPSLGLEFSIDVPDDWEGGEEGDDHGPEEDHRSGLPLSNALVLLDQSEGEISLLSGLLQPLVDSGEIRGGSSSTADRIYTTDQDGDVEIYYYQEAPVFAGGNGWRKLGASVSSDQKDSLLLVAGEGHSTFAVLIRERAAEEGDVLQVYSDPHHYEVDLSALPSEEVDDAIKDHVLNPSLTPGELEQPK
jgi:hypothetical protein